MTIEWPVTNDAASESSQTTPSPISEGWPKRPTGSPLAKSSSFIWPLWKLQSERLNDARRRLFGELAGRTEQVQDPANPGQMKTVTVRPDISEVGILIGRLLNVDQHEADGLYAPNKAEVLSAVTGQAVSDEELDIWLARLTPQERETFMMLLAKAQGRWVEPPAIEEGSIETTATTVQSNGAGS